MQDITLEEIQNKFESLPENLRLAIIVAGADKKINTIGREHGLNVNQISELLLKTHIMMFGFIHPDKFEDSVKEIINIPAIVVRGIVRDVNEQILKDIRDELIELAEKPEKPEEIEPSFESEVNIPISQKIEKEIKPIEPDVLLNQVEINKNVEKEKSTTEKEKSDEILKSAGIEINSLTLEEENKKGDIETKHEPTYTQTTSTTQEQKNTIENKKDSDILKSAGIEITPFGFENKIKNKIETLPAKKTKEEENKEVIKVAFENLEKREIEKVNIPIEPIEEKSNKEDAVKPLKEIVSPATFIKSKEEIKPKELNTPIKQKEITTTTVLMELKEQQKPIEINAPIEPKEISPKEELKEITAPSNESEGSLRENAIREETKKIVPTILKEETREVIKPEEIKEIIKPQEIIVATTKTVAPPEGDIKNTTPVQDIKEKTITPAVKTEVENIEHKVEEINKKEEKNLKSIVKNINAYYQTKAKNTTPIQNSSIYTIKSIPRTEEPLKATEPNYENPEKQKNNLILAIVEVQNKIKVIKERTVEIDKEKDKLEKEKKELSKVDKDSKEISGLSNQLSDLYDEEKIIQKLREVNLPKEYLELLEKLDKLSNKK